MKIGSLFAGIGGFDLAARWMGWETAWFSEIDPYASAVLARHWPGVPNHGDITAIDFAQVEPVDMLCGGFPCQDLSVAGKRKGLSGERSGLWSDYARAIRALQPRWVVIENVPPLLTGGYAVVRGDLRAAGYRVARPVLMSASAVGAPHLRERLWIVAHAHSAREPQQTGRLGGQRGRTRDSSATLDHPDGLGLRGDEWRHDEERRRALPTEGCSVVELTSRERRAERRSEHAGHERGSTAPEPGGVIPWEHGVWCEGADGTVRLIPPIESGIWPVAHGVPSRMVRIRGVGNAIVPQEAFQIFRAIEAHDDQLVEVAS